MKRYLYKVAFKLLRIYWFIFRPKTQGALVSIYHKNKILLVRHTYGKNLWRLPGGGVKPREFPIETIKREAWEELGIKLKNPKQIGTKIYTDQYRHNTVWFFAEEIANVDFKMDPVEIKEAAWFAIDNLPRPLAKSVFESFSPPKL